MSRDMNDKRPSQDGPKVLWTNDGHPDEGSLYAWIDSAFNAHSAALVDGHVERCRQCSDAVSEFRGYDAAASGILAIVDAGADVQVDRSQNRAALAAVVAGSTGTRSSPHPIHVGWWQGRAAQVMAIAAVVIFMVAAATWITKYGAGSSVNDAPTVATKDVQADTADKTSEVAARAAAANGVDDSALRGASPRTVSCRAASRKERSCRN